MPVAPGSPSAARAGHAIPWLSTAAPVAAMAEIAFERKVMARGVKGFGSTDLAAKGKVAQWHDDMVPKSNHAQVLRMREFLSDRDQVTTESAAVNLLSPREAIVVFAGRAQWQGYG